LLFLYHTLCTTKEKFSIHEDYELFIKMGAKRNFLPSFLSSLFHDEKRNEGKDFTGGAKITIGNRLVAPESKFALTNFPVLSFLCRFPHAHTYSNDEEESQVKTDFSKELCV
jgi:hypothetical protein